MELTNEEIAKVFAMYGNCESINITGYKLAHLHYIGHSAGHSCGVFQYKPPPFENGTGATEIFYWSKVKLCLTPLDKITDEHAIEVGKIWGYVVDKINPGILEKCHRIARDYSKIITNTTTAIEINEYLKSKGYAVKLWFGIDHWANGKTAIELKIAKDKTLTE